MVPDYVFKPACKRHDACYGTYPGPSKETCDNRFRRHSAAEGFYRAVKHGGGRAFRNARKKAKEKYEERVRMQLSYSKL